jgi:CRP-like cAMP-binding protein
MSDATRIHEALERFARNSKLFVLLDDAGRRKLALAGSFAAVAPDTLLVREGDTGDAFYLIVSGEVRVLVGAERKEVARLGPGMFFGEVAVMTRQPRTATVESVGACELLRFTREPVAEILADYPKVREIIGSVGLTRSEQNLERKGADDPGLAELLEGDEPLADSPTDDEDAS